MSLPRLLNEVKILVEALDPGVAADVAAVNAKIDIIDANLDEVYDAAGLTNGQSVLPDLADGVTLTGGAGAWAEGAYAEIVAALAADSYIVSVEATGITGLHQVTIARGALAAEVDIATLRIPAAGVYQVRVPKLLAGTRISAKTASKAGGAQAVDIAITITT